MAKKELTDSQKHTFSGKIDKAKKKRMTWTDNVSNRPLSKIEDLKLEMKLKKELEL